MRPGLPILAAAAVGVQVGAAIVASRYVIGQTTPVALALLRYAIGVLCLVPALMLAQRVRFAARDVIPIGLLGIVQFGVLIVERRSRCGRQAARRCCERRVAGSAGGRRLGGVRGGVQRSLSTIPDALSNAARQCRRDACLGGIPWCCGCDGRVFFELAAI